MKNSMTRMLAILLAMLMIVGAFAMTACGDEVDEEQGDPSGEPGGEENQTPDEEEEE